MKALSGGERNRLLLARLFARPANVLVMDEPTNDLDIESLELLEDTLQNYAGTLLLVSHDRAFLDNVVTQTLVAEGNGKWQEYVGGYSRLARATPSALRAAPAKQKAESRSDDARRSAPTKMSYKETRELAQLPAGNRGAGAAATGAHGAHEQRRLSQAGQRADQGRPAARRARSNSSSRQKFARWEALEAKQSQAEA